MEELGAPRPRSSRPDLPTLLSQHVVQNISRYLLLLGCLESNRISYSSRESGLSALLLQREERLSKEMQLREEKMKLEREELEYRRGVEKEEAEEKHRRDEIERQ